MANDIADFYGEGLWEEIKRSFDEWRESDFSVCQFMLEMKAAEEEDDDAFISARSLEDEMEHIVEEMLRERPETPETSLEADLTQDISETFEEILDGRQEKVREYEDFMEESEREIADKCEEQEIYEAIKPIILSVQKAHNVLYDKCIEGVENLKENIEDRGERSKDSMEQTSEAKVADAENVADEFMDVSMFWDLD